MNNDIRRIGSLEIEEDFKVQQIVWAAQRVGWAVLTLIAFAALLGLFGRGWLSKVTAEAEGVPLKLNYERFGRVEAPMQLEVNIEPQAVRDGKVRLWVSSEYVRSFAVESIIPEPEQVEVGGDRFTYEFTAQDESGPVLINFTVLPDEMGPLSAQIGLAGEEGIPPLSLDQFIYP